MPEVLVYTDVNQSIYRDTDTGLFRRDWTNPPARSTYVDIADFANNTNPLQAAVTKAAGAGRAVMLSEAVVVPDTITAASPVRIHAAHSGITATATGADFDMFELTANNHGSEFVGFTLRGGADDDTTTQFGIYSADAGGPDLVTVRAMRVALNGSLGLNNFVKVYQGDDWQIVDCHVRGLIGTDVTNTGYGVLTARANRITVDHCQFIGGTAVSPMGRHGVYMTIRTRDSIVSNVLVSGYQRTGIFIKSGSGADVSCDRNLVEGCTVIDGGEDVTDNGGIALGGQAKRNRIVGCVVDGIDGIGVAIIPTDAGFIGADQLQDNSITGCTISNTTGAAVELQSTNRTVVKGNTIRDVATDGDQAAVVIRGNGPFGQGDDVGSRIVENDFGGTVGRGSVEVSALGTTTPSGYVIDRNVLVTGSVDDVILPA